MNCQKCGNALVPGDAFCRVCGTPVPSNNMSAPAAQPATPAANPIPGAMNFVQSPATAAPVANNEVNNVQQPQPVVAAPINGAPQVPPVQPVPAPMPAPAGPVMPANNIASEPVTPSVAPMQEPMPATAVDDEPTKKKTSPLLIVLLIVVLAGVVVFDVMYLPKMMGKKGGESETPVPVEEETVEYTPWMDYLLGKSITSITIERTPSEGEKKTVTLTDDNLKNIFAKIVDYSLIKRYYEGTSVTEGDIITIAYTSEEQSYTVKIANGMLLANDTDLADAGLKDTLEESEYTTENEELKDKEGASYNYVFSGYDSTILDEYFATE